MRPQQLALPSRQTFLHHSCRRITPQSRFRVAHLSATVVLERFQNWCSPAGTGRATLQPDLGDARNDGTFKGLTCAWAAYPALGAGGSPGHGGPESLLGKRLPYCAAEDCSNRSIALAKPSSSFEAVTNVADFCTSGLALPIAMLTPLFLNIRTSFGMSPMVAIWLGGMLQSCENIPTTSPLFALGFVTSR